MIDSPIFFAGMTYLPATLGFMGCIKPKIVFPIAILTVLGIAGFSLSAIISGFETSYKLMWVGGIEFTFDQYTFPLLLGASLSLGNQYSSKLAVNQLNKGCYFLEIIVNEYPVVVKKLIIK